MNLGCHRPCSSRRPHGPHWVSRHHGLSGTRPASATTRHHALSCQKGGSPRHHGVCVLFLGHHGFGVPLPPFRGRPERDLHEEDWAWLGGSQLRGSSDEARLGSAGDLEWLLRAERLGESPSQRGMPGSPRYHGVAGLPRSGTPNYSGARAGAWANMTTVF